MVKTARGRSTPGLTGVLYKVYKNCPRRPHRLWRRGKVAHQWRFAEGVWILEEEESKSIDQFRIMSVLSVEAKIFFTVVGRRLTDFLLRHTYLDTSVQKEGIPKVPGYLDHTGIVRQLIGSLRSVMMLIS